MQNPLSQCLAYKSLEDISNLVCKQKLKSVQQIKQYLAQQNPQKQNILYKELMELINKDPLNQQHFCQWLQVFLDLNINTLAVKKYQQNVESKIVTTNALIRLQGKLQAVTNQHQYQQQLQKGKEKEKGRVEVDRMIQYKEQQDEPFQTDSDDELEVDRKKSIEYIQKDSSEDEQEDELLEEEEEDEEMEVEENSEWD